METQLGAITLREKIAFILTQYRLFSVAPRDEMLENYFKFRGDLQEGNPEDDEESRDKNQILYFLKILKELDYKFKCTKYIPRRLFKNKEEIYIKLRKLIEKDTEENWRPWLTDWEFSKKIISNQKKI